MNTTAALQLGLALLPLVQAGVGEFIQWLAALRTALQQTGEWSPEQEAGYRQALLAKTGDPAYQPDAE